MAGYAQNINTFTDYGVAQQDVERKRRMAELLQQQSMQPIEQKEGVPISWTQGLAKLLQGYNAGQGMRSATEEQKALAARRNQAMAETLGAMPAAKQVPMEGSQSDVDQYGMAPQTEMTQPTMQDNTAWLGKLAQIRPEATQIGGTMLGMQQKGQENDENRALRQSESALARQATQAQAQAAREGRIHELEMRLQDARITAQDRAALQRELASQKADLTRELAEGRNQNDLALKELGRGLAANQPVTAVTLQDPNNPNGTIVIDGRSGKVFGKGPKLTDTGKLENKRQFNMQGIGAIIQEADNLLTGAGGRPLPTGSGLGSVWDAAGGVFGMSPSGSAEADRIRAVGGALVSKIPRMEGPQSDRDVALYKESAGRIGDSSIPVERRKAALETVKGLWAKYENLNPSAFQGGPTPGASGAWDDSKEQRYQELLRRRNGGS